MMSSNERLSKHYVKKKEKKNRNRDRNMTILSHPAIFIQMDRDDFSDNAENNRDQAFMQLV